MSINLIKGQKIKLEKPGGGVLSTVFMGLGWDPASGRGEIDLDASCLMFDGNKNKVDVVYFGQLKSRDNSVIHSGDNLTGDGDGDDEVINVNLSLVPSNVESLVFTVNSYSGQTFNEIVNCFARLVDKSSNTELCKYVLTESGSVTAMAMAKIYKHNGEWKMHALGSPMNGRTAMDLIQPVKSLL